MTSVQALFAIYAATILPVVLVAVAGYVLAAFLSLDPSTLGRLLFYLATPALVFRSLYSMDIDLTSLQHIAVVTLAVLFASGTAGWVASVGQDRRRRSAMILTSAISNNGNMGIPICLFALGEAGLALGTVYYAITSFVGNTLGVVVASAGSTPIARALLQSLGAPVLYAATLGLVMNRLSIEVPQSLFRSIDLLAGAAIPGMLVLLGVQLRATTMERNQTIVWRSSLIRLIVAPIIAALLCVWLGVGGLERQVLIIQAGMPTAVMTSVLATEFNTAPKLVAAAILVSTLLSMVTLSFILLLVT